jgi:predicted enzyme related to lactoylglutathione lyase
MRRFFQLTLRTLDVDAARAFYTTLLGEVPLEIVPLHEQAVARGARPHWLGFLDVGDVDRAADAFCARGATPLAKKWVNPKGVEAAVLRDPGGAVIALAKPATDGRAAEARGPEVVWYELNTANVEQAKTSYGELVGWAFDEPVALGEHGVLHPFAWCAGGAPVGSMSDLAGRPGVHAHWLFHLRVDSLTRAMDAVQRANGVVIGPIALPNGDQVAVCDDPQGAAFAIRQLR